MKLPKINFVYSFIYDEIWKGDLFILNNKKVKSDYPSSRKVKNYLKKINRIWYQNDKKILIKLSKVSQLQWKEKNINCYIVGKCIPFSDPLTISIYNKPYSRFIDILVHELIHRLFVQNIQKSNKAWKYIDKKYKKESKRTRIHILLYAIQSYIYLEIFNKKRLKRDIKWAQKHKDYKRAWEIVQKEGYQNIIKEFRKRIKK